jgi:anaerobic ribonucleoside-triphosphate reductase
MENVKNAENKHVYNEQESKCHDCKKEIKINNKEIENGVYLTYDNNGKKISIFKCNECFEKNKALVNFQECEVYSRVVGYLRPVSQWHKGKKQEYEERKEFNSSSCCN